MHSIASLKVSSAVRGGAIGDHIEAFEPETDIDASAERVYDVADLDVRFVELGRVSLSCTDRCRAGLCDDRPFFHAEVARQKRLRDRYLRLKPQHPDKPPDWWFDTHGIDGTEMVDVAFESSV
jgi:hypothetical protein